MIDKFYARLVKVIVNASGQNILGIPFHRVCGDRNNGAGSQTLLEFRRADVTRGLLAIIFGMEISVKKISGRAA